MTPKYRFYLQIGEDGEKQVVNPNYKDDLALDYKLETNQRFYRAKLSGKINFVRADYNIINDAPFDSEFFLYIEKSDDWGQTYNQYYKAMFMKTDCTFNDDDKLVTVQPETIDEYNNVLAGLEKEYNLIELAPEIKYLTIRKRPLIQIYIPGDSIVSCFLGGTNWEQDANVVTDTNELINKYYFSVVGKFRKIDVKATFIGYDPADGTYYGKLGGKYYNSNGYYIQAEQVLGQVAYQLKLYDNNGNLAAYTDVRVGIDPVGTYQFKKGSGGVTFTYDATGTENNIYARYLCDVDKIDDLTTYDLPIDDIVDNNRNYKKAIGYAIDVVFSSVNFSYEPTEWGLASNGRYYLPPYSIYGAVFYPISRSTWGNYSLWFSFAIFDWILEEKARKAYTLKDTFTLSSCINVLLKQFAPEITHEATPEYSQFLYNTNNPISGQSFKLLISQKSNIINGEYQTPAQKAPVTLQQIMTMLRDIYKCYWYIEDGKFKIEQVSWFRNGGSYGYNPIIDYDLTQLENVRNGKKLAFATSEYSFDKVEMPERYQFEWMDDVTTPFEGLPIEITSKYVTAGKIEEINISNFTSDIDLMLLNPGAISADGFALFAAVTPSGGGQLELPFTKQTVENVEYYLQNGYLAFINIQPTYWVYDMPARNFKINNSQSYAVGGIERKKKQTLNFPAETTDPNPMQLVKTYIGNGQVDKLSVNLCSRNIKATLKYDTE